MIGHQFKYNKKARAAAMRLLFEQSMHWLQVGITLNELLIVRCVKFNYLETGHGVSANTIASICNLPQETVRRRVVKLMGKGWLERKGFKRGLFERRQGGRGLLVPGVRLDEFHNGTADDVCDHIIAIANFIREDA